MTERYTILRIHSFTFSKSNGAFIWVDGVQYPLISDLRLRYEANLAPQIGDAPAAHYVSHPSSSIVCESPDAE